MTRVMTWPSRRLVKHFLWRRQLSQNSWSHHPAACVVSGAEVLAGPEEALTVVGVPACLKYVCHVPQENVWTCAHCIPASHDSNTLV